MMKKLLTVLAFCLIAGAAYADQPFTSFAYPGTGSNNVNRTSPARIADVRNAKDYGCVGDNSTPNDTCFLNVIAAACADASSAGGSIYVPPGTYLVNSFVDIAPSSCSIRMFGAGKTATKIVGNIDYSGSKCLLDRGVNRNGVDQIEYMSIQNLSTAANSCTLRFNGNGPPGGPQLLNSLSLFGHQPLDIAISPFSTTVMQSDIVCNPDNGVGTVGAGAGQVNFIGVSVTGCENGVIFFNAGASFIGGRFEGNGNAITLGQCPPYVVLNPPVTSCNAGDASQIAGFHMSSVEFEGNYIGIYLRSCSACVIDSVAVTGGANEVKNSSGIQKRTAYTNLEVGFATQTVISASQFSGQTTAAGIDMAGSGFQGQSLKFDSVLGAPATQGTCTACTVSGTTLTVAGVTASNYGVGMTISGTGINPGDCTTCSVAGNVLTVAGATASNYHVGATISCAACPTGVTIDMLGTGAGGNGTYVLSRNLGTIAAQSIQALVTITDVTTPGNGGNGTYTISRNLGTLTARSITASGGVGWNLPLQYKATVAYDNSNNPASGLTFADLPVSPTQGTQFFIINANTATIGDPVTAGGVPNTPGFVVWNGTGWTLMSK